MMQYDLFANEKGWREIPDFVISREGKKVNTTSDLWNLPYSIDTYGSQLDFSKIPDENLKWVLKSLSKFHLSPVIPKACHGSI